MCLRWWFVLFLITLSRWSSSSSSYDTLLIEAIKARKLLLLCIITPSNLITPSRYALFRLSVTRTFRGYRSLRWLLMVRKWICLEIGTLERAWDHHVLKFSQYWNHQERAVCTSVTLTHCKKELLIAYSLYQLYRRVGGATVTHTNNTPGLNSTRDSQ